jgi:hypothetical protein
MVLQKGPGYCRQQARIRANNLIHPLHLSNLALRVVAERKTAWLLDASPIFIFEILVARRRDA